jgi:hypothetical protein
MAPLASEIVVSIPLSPSTTKRSQEIKPSPNMTMAPLASEIVVSIPLSPPSTKRSVSFKKSVSFSPISQIRKITHIAQSSSEVQKLWWTHQDFRDFRKGNKITVWLMDNSTITRDSDSHCARGLEGSTQQGGQRRSMRIASQLAVFEEQRLQMEEGVYDDVFLAHIYIHFSIRAAIQALDVGLKDQAFVQEKVLTATTTTPKEQSKLQELGNDSQLLALRSSKLHTWRRFRMNITKE